jgi:predicted PurR-regulated permease PerM
MQRVLDNPWVRVILVLAGIVVLVLLLQVLWSVLTPFAVGFAIAYFMNPAVNALERAFARPLARLPRLARRIEARAAALAVMITFSVVALVAAVLIVVPAVSHQIGETVARAPEYARVLQAKAGPLLAGLRERYPEQMADAEKRLQAAVSSNLPDVIDPVTRVIKVALSSALSFVLTLLNLLVVPVFAAYLLYDMNRIREGAKNLVPHRYRPYVYSRAQRIDGLLAAFARGQITVALILGVFYAIGLTACGVPLGLLVGLVIGSFNLVPFMSHLLGLPLALVLSWVDDQDTTKLLIVIGVFVFGQFVEGNFISPRIVGESVGLHAVVMMLAVLIGGTLFGFLGMLLAVPATATLSVFYDDLEAMYLASQFYRGEPEA